LGGAFHSFRNKNAAQALKHADQIKVQRVPQPAALGSE